MGGSLPLPLALHILASIPWAPNVVSVSMGRGKFLLYRAKPLHHPSSIIHHPPSAVALGSVMTYGRSSPRPSRNDIKKKDPISSMQVGADLEAQRRSDAAQSRFAVPAGHKNPSRIVDMYRRHVPAFSALSTSYFSAAYSSTFTFYVQ